MSKEPVKWGNVRVPQNLIDEVAEFVESEEGKRVGYRNISQLATDALQEFLRRVNRRRFEHINTYEDKIRVLDNSIPPSGDIVTVRIRRNKLACEICEADDCIHVKYCWSIPDVSKKLKQKGFRPLLSLL